MNDTILRQQETIRRSGAVNMFDVKGVQREAFERDFHELVTFIEEASSKEYLDMAEDAAKAFRDEDL